LEVPVTNISYSYVEITQNINNVTSVYIENEKELKTLRNKKDILEKVPESKENNNKLRDITNEFKKKEIDVNFIEDIKNSWEHLAFYNHEYREKHDNIESTITPEDFEEFIGLKKGDYFSRIIEIFGKPDRREEGVMSYNYKVGTGILEIGYDPYTEKITSIFLNGKGGFDFVKTNIKINDLKINLIGRKLFKLKSIMPGCNVSLRDNYGHIKCKTYSLSSDIFLYDKIAKSITVKW